MPSPVPFTLTPERSDRMSEHSSSTNGHGDAAAIENLDDLLAADDRPIRKVYSPHLKRHVYLRAMTAEARDALERENFPEDEKGEAKLKTDGRLARTLAVHLVNAKGDRIVVGPEAITRLNKQMSAPALTHLVIECGKLSQTDEDSLERETKN